MKPWPHLDQGGDVLKGQAVEGVEEGMPLLALLGRSALSVIAL
jgi:hypothetical protein